MQQDRLGGTEVRPQNRPSILSRRHYCDPRTKMNKCAYCGKENDDESPNCVGCGVSLVAQSSEAPSAPVLASKTQRQIDGQRLMRNGGLWFAGGMVVTVVSYVLASDSPRGGHYFVAYGALIVGLVQFLRGRAMASGDDSGLEAKELLNQAARLEGVDRAKAIAIYAEIIKSFPNTRASAEAQRNIQTLRSHQA